MYCIEYIPKYIMTIKTLFWVRGLGRELGYNDIYHFFEKQTYFFCYIVYIYMCVYVHTFAAYGHFVLVIICTARICFEPIKIVTLSKYDRLMLKECNEKLHKRGRDTSTLISNHISIVEVHWILVNILRSKLCNDLFDPLLL